MISVDLLVKHQNDPWWKPPWMTDVEDVFDAEGEESEGDAGRSSAGPKAFIARRARSFQPDPLSAFR